VWEKVWLAKDAIDTTLTAYNYNNAVPIRKAKQEIISSVHILLMVKKQSCIFEKS
jgi:hypothetical protein